MLYSPPFVQIVIGSASFFVPIVWKQSRGLSNPFAKSVAGRKKGDPRGVFPVKIYPFLWNALEQLPCMSILFAGSYTR